MRRFQNMAISTTSTLEGYEVLQYVDVLSSHVVAGTGVISDIFAGVSDFFGGRSMSYKRQLSAIHREAISELKHNAKDIGANAIIGLRIDVDSISGKNMQMFMVTATGTAIIAEKETPLNNERYVNKGELDNEELHKIIIQKDLIENPEQINFELSEKSELWKFILNNDIPEIAQRLIELHDERVADFDIAAGYFVNVFQEYSGRHFENENVIKLLYSALTQETRNVELIIETIEKKHLLDYHIAQNLIGLTNKKVDKIALKLLTYEKGFYKESDIKNIEDAIAKVKSHFKIIVESSEDKSVFSSKIKKRWICKCGVKVDDTEDECPRCTMDRFGFKHGEVKPGVVLDILAKRRAALKEYFEVV